MSFIAIITARGGSKRIPKKNIRLFMGKPMICYAIEAARKSNIFSEVMVSTDDSEIKEIAEDAGAVVPFLRSEATANDFATTRDVLLEVINEYAKRGTRFNRFSCIYPCVPFLTSELLMEAKQKFEETNAEALMPVVKFSFPIQRAVCINGEGFLEYREPENILKRSQDLKATYHDVGMFYFYKTESFLENRIQHMVPFVMPEERIQDIDTLDDWKMAELKYKIINP